MVRIVLPPKWYYNSHWMGFAICAVFSFHKHPSAINLDSGFLHPFKCHVETDLGCVRPFYESSISEAQVGNDQRSIIWVLFAPRWVFSEQWSEITWVEFSFMSESEHVSALKCGVRLVFQEDMEEFTRTYAQLMSSFVAFEKDVRSRRSPSRSPPLLPPLAEEILQHEDPHHHKTGPLVRLLNRDPHPHNHLSSLSL
jgi:hypothetical protein